MSGRGRTRDRQKHRAGRLRVRWQQEGEENSPPAEAYLPSAIDKNEGWPTAAAQTPGLLWVDSSYSDVLKGARGQGALATLKALGRATAPRLSPGRSRPATRTRPRCVKRAARAFSTRTNYSEYPRATGLRNDWVSPDLEAAMRDMRHEKRSTVRRKRARALFLALDRAWDEQYASSSVAEPSGTTYAWHN